MMISTNMEVKTMLKLTGERIRRGWTKAEVARRAGLHPSTVGAIEGERIRPYACQLAKLADALGWPPDAASGLLDPVSGLGPVAAGASPGRFGEWDR